MTRISGCLLAACCLACPSWCGEPGAGAGGESRHGDALVVSATYL